MPEALHALGLS